MNKSVKALTRSALCAAAGTVILYMSGILPWGKLALLCAASFGVVFVRMSCSAVWALGCYAVTAALGLMLLPVKAPGIMYACFLGFYPMIRIYSERIRNPVGRAALKLAVFNVSAFLVYQAYRLVFFDLAGSSSLPLYALWLGDNAVFLVYDYALGLMILYYLRNLAGRFK